MKYICLFSLLSLSILSYSQTNNFPLYSSGDYSPAGASGDYTNITSPQLKLKSISGYPRVVHISASPGVSSVYNFETGKNAYWGESGDAGQYLFRGRDMVVEQGKLGVGTNSPFAKLHILSSRADLFIQNTNANDWSFLRIQGSGTNLWDIGQYGDNDYLEFRPKGLDANRVVIKQSGYVGMGTISPSARLDIFEAGGPSGQFSALRIRNGNSFNYFGNNQVLFSYNGNTGYSHAIRTRHNSGAVSGNALDFYVWKPGDAVDAIGSNLAMTLDGGNLGIGTTSPGAWFPSKAIEINSNRPVLKLAAALPSDLSTILFTNNNVDAVNHTGEFHVNYQFVQSDNSKSLLKFSSYPASDMFVMRSDGNIGIGSTNPDSKLTVNGTIHSKEVKIDLTVPGPDYVFEKDYPLPSLEQIKSYIDQNKHLPEVPSAKEMEANGVNVGEMNMLLLKKVEELTLYVIEANKRMDAQQMRIDKQEKEIEKLKLK